MPDPERVIDLAIQIVDRARQLGEPFVLMKASRTARSASKYIFLGRPGFSQLLIRVSDHRSPEPTDLDLVANGRISLAAAKTKAFDFLERVYDQSLLT